MGKSVKRIILLISMVYICLLGMALTALAADDQIEQIYVNKPDVVAYYRAENGNGTVRGYLGGEELSLDENLRFSETGESIQYFVLVDISGSINDTRFSDVKSSLTAFLQEMRKEDRMLLYTFGDEVTPVLSGDESREAAGEKIAELTNYDKNTVLFDAIGQAADIISEAENKEQQKWVLIIISDGEDYADNTKTAQSTTDRLISLGIPAYTIAVENDMGYSDQVLSQYQGNFSSVASQTGGIAWTPGKQDTLSHSIMEALDNIQSNILGSYRASFHSENNKISNQEEQFVLEFPDGKTDLRNVLINRNQPDDVAPTVSIQEKTENSFCAVYSEKVEGAEEVSNYLVSLDGKNIGVDQVVRDEEKENSYLLIMKEDLKNTVYHINISNVTDASHERNPLKNGELDVEVSSVREMDTTPPTVTLIKQSEKKGFLVTFSEPVVNADNTGNYNVTYKEETVAVQQVLLSDEKANTYLLLLGSGLENGEYKIKIGGNIADASPEANELKETEQTITVTGIKINILNLIRQWWWIVLTAAVLALAILLLLFKRKIRKKNITVIDGTLIEQGDVERKVHVGMVGGLNFESPQQGKPIVMWLSNGKDEPKRIEHSINGSCFVGRSEKMCEIYCDDPMMSKQHFNLSVEADGNVYVTDLGSLNGTAVNGVRIQGSRKLEPGDEISAGNIRFVIQW